jgi:IS30 family transposase
MPKTYKHLTEDERDRLSLFKAHGKSLREIAGLIGRDVSTVSRELKRNAPPIRQGYYLPHRAQARADARKAAAHERERLRKPGLRAYAGRMLRRGWSPERIAGRWNTFSRESVSHEAIYQWVYIVARELIPFLVRARRKRLRRGHSSKHKSSHIPSRTPISQRPAIVERRERVLPVSGPDFRVGALIFSPRRPVRAAGRNHGEREKQTVGGCASGC